jgi:hypothetical protein
VLCEREPRCAVRAKGQPASVAPTLGYLGDEGHCWVPLADAQSWSNGRISCENLQFLDGTGTGRLAVLDVGTVFANLPGVGFLTAWVGGSQAISAKAVDEGWSWVDGTAMDLSLPWLWATDRPNDKILTSGVEDHEEDVAYLNDQHRLDDSEAERDRASLCEVF